MTTVTIFAIPIMLVLFPLFFMIIFCYPVRKKDDVIIIGYPIYCKKYSLPSSDFNIEVERVSTFRGGSWAVFIRVYQKNNRALIGKHMLQGHFFLKSAEKELNKVTSIIFPSQL